MHKYDKFKKGHWELVGGVKPSVVNNLDRPEKKQDQLAVFPPTFIYQNITTFSRWERAVGKQKARKRLPLSVTLECLASEETNGQSCFFALLTQTILSFLRNIQNAS